MRAVDACGRDKIDSFETLYNMVIFGYWLIWSFWLITAPLATTGILDG